MNDALNLISADKIGDPEAAASIFKHLWDRQDTAHYSPQADGPRLSRWGQVRKAAVRAGARFRSPPVERRDAWSYWDSHRDEILAQSQALKDQLQEKVAERERILHFLDFQKELEDGKLSISIPGVGKAEVNTIDGQRFIRVVHSSTELSLLYIGAAAVSKESKHLRQFVARQLFDAGKDRTDGIFGRNVVILWQKYNRTTHGEFRAKPSPKRFEWWRQYWYATFKAPTLKSVPFAAFMAVVQGVLALLVLMFKSLLVVLNPLSWRAVKLLFTGRLHQLYAGLVHFFSSGGFALLKAAAFKPLMVWSLTVFGPVFFTVGFGFVIGLFISSYKTWTYRGSVPSQYFKSMVISALFAYPVKIFQSGLGALASLAVQTALILNMVLNNFGKMAWQNPIPKMFEKYQHAEAVKPMFFGFKAGDVYNQGFYLVNWTIRFIGLISPGIFGNILQLAGAAVGLKVAYKYARRHGYPEAEHLQLSRIPGLMLSKLARTARWTTAFLKKCALGAYEISRAFFYEDARPAR